MSTRPAPLTTRQQLQLDRPEGRCVVGMSLAVTTIRKVWIHVWAGNFAIAVRVLQQAEQEHAQPVLADIDLDGSLHQLDLPQRTINVLDVRGVITVRDFREFDIHSIAELRTVGQKALEQMTRAQRRALQVTDGPS